VRLESTASIARSHWSGLVHGSGTWVTPSWRVLQLSTAAMS